MTDTERGRLNTSRSLSVCLPPSLPLLPAFYFLPLSGNKTKQPLGGKKVLLTSVVASRFFAVEFSLSLSLPFRVHSGARRTDGQFQSYSITPPLNASAVLLEPRIIRRGNCLLICQSAEAAFAHPSDAHVPANSEQTVTETTLRGHFVEGVKAKPLFWRHALISGWQFNRIVQARKMSPLST